MNQIAVTEEEILNVEKMKLNAQTLSPKIKKVAILGAGVMGAQIAALFANASIEVILYDLAKEGAKDKNEIINQALKALKKINPAPLGSTKAINYIKPANYDENLVWLSECDLVIEAIAEKLEWKEALYQKISTHIREGALFASNTSGLSINTLADNMPERLRSGFCGIHFFNPPRYLPLVELIPHKVTDPKILDQLETFLTTKLGKNVIRAKDTPNFIANRLGAFALACAMYYTEKYDIGFEVIDELTGKPLGRPKSATFRTADLVGLDTLNHVTNNMTLFAKEDPWLSFYQTPKWFENLIKNNKLGAKTKGGIYEKRGKEIWVYDIKTNDYRLADQKANKEVLEILKEKDVKTRFEKLKASSLPEAKFLYSVFRDCFHYAAYWLEHIAETTRDCDLALRWGFGWKEGIFETWQKAGWRDIAQWIEADIKSGEISVDAPLPAWVNAVDSAYDVHGLSYNAREKTYQPRAYLDVYEKQYFFDSVLNESFDWGTTVYENEGIRLWTTGDRILVATFKTKMGAIGSDVLEGLQQAVKIAETDDFESIVIWNDSKNFSAGANLEEFGMAFMLDGVEAIEEILKNFQNTVIGMRYAQVPVVAAVQGFVFGGACELMLHCDRVVAAYETYTGLVEVGVGLVPAGAGCKEMALRAQQSIDPEKQMQQYYKNIAMGEVAKSAAFAKEMGYLREEDVIIFQPAELLYVAKIQAKALAQSNYMPKAKPQIKAFGRDAKATIDMMLVNMLRGNFISDYDYYIASNIARIMTGDNVDKGTLVNEDWYLKLEREVFCDLVQQDKTAQRIEHMLTKGKPLRN
ncbi:3-hydroxyacyl-CoA dehydrogenase/enoyl-CoA hydratase family protein [Thiotrichales bacterium 19S11-10]|nr:3-hydroxyacyl-CoA dehydrogenase/enoyl-CoA hydratase family protein [Thiotrichales bacterium 19S11-10]